MLPKKVAESLAHIDTSTLPGRINDDDLCEGAKFHSPKPLLVHQMTLEDDGRQAWLCGTCVATSLSTNAWLSSGDLPWPLAREFGNRLRAVVRQSPPA